MGLIWSCLVWYWFWSWSCLCLVLGVLPVDLGFDPSHVDIRFFVFSLSGFGLVLLWCFILVETVLAFVLVLVQSRWGFGFCFDFDSVFVGYCTWFGLSHSLKWCCQICYFLDLIWMDLCHCFLLGIRLSIWLVNLHAIIEIWRCIKMKQCKHKKVI